MRFTHLKQRMIEWAWAQEKLLTQSQLGYRPRTSEAMLMETCTVLQTNGHRDYSPDVVSLPRHVRKLDRILCMQPKEYQRIAEDMFLHGRKLSPAESRKLTFLYHRIHACWPMVSD